MLSKLVSYKIRTSVFNLLGTYLKYSFYSYKEGEIFRSAVILGTHSFSFIY